MEINHRHMGFYGKLPQLGDFIRRGLPGFFVTPWDAWLQEGMLSSRDKLGERWLDLYLKSPLWRFVLSSGLFGAPNWLGIMMPSVDRVGRYFPFTVATQLPPDINPYFLAGKVGTWCDAVEGHMLMALNDEEINLDKLGQKLAIINNLTESCLKKKPKSIPSPSPDMMEVRLANLAEPQDAYPELMLVLADTPCSLWWTAGSEHVDTCLRWCVRMPSTKDFWRFMVSTDETKYFGI